MRFHGLTFIPSSLKKEKRRKNRNRVRANIGVLPAMAGRYSGDREHPKRRNSDRLNKLSEDVVDDDDDEIGIDFSERSPFRSLGA